jgi:hypothetical protein
MTNRKIECWVIPPKADAEFVANMAVFEKTPRPLRSFGDWPQKGPKSREKRRASIAVTGTCGQTEVWPGKSRTELLSGTKKRNGIEKTPVFEALTGENYPSGNTSRPNQLSLFGL